MPDLVSHRAGGNEVTKLTRQFRNGLSESSSNNLCPIGSVLPVQDTSCGGRVVHHPLRRAVVQTVLNSQHSAV
eukprot:31473-Pelagococcus_subviridis.AAC.3